MQLNNITAFVALIVGVVAIPSYHPAPPPPPQAKPTPPSVPTINNPQSISCSSGSPYCCSPADPGDKSKGTTCVAASTSCNSVTICCNNAAIVGTASQSCGANTLQVPINFA